MKIFIFINLILCTFSILPIWNLKNSSIDLLGSSSAYEYTIANRRMYEISMTLKKKITKNSENISHKNYLTMTGEKTLADHEVAYENVESFYGKSTASNILILCPMGYFNPINLNTMSEITFDKWNNTDYWDLKCYYHSTGTFLMFYFMNGKNQSQAKPNGKSWVKYENLQFYDELYDFKLKNNNDDGYTDNFPFMALIKNNSLIKLYGAKIKFGDEVVERNDEISIDLTESKQNTKGYFNNVTTDFYYITYNDVTDFSSGYSINPAAANSFEIANTITFENNNGSPFEFLDEVEIKEINFLPYNKYVYYSIYNKNTKKTYHGILI